MSFIYCLSWHIYTASPITRNTTLAFCGYSGPTCCNATDDSAIQAKFTAMNITDASCASIVKSIVCAVCMNSLLEFSEIHTGNNLLIFKNTYRDIRFPIQCLTNPCQILPWHLYDIPSTASILVFLRKMAVWISFIFVITFSSFSVYPFCSYTLMLH